MILKSKLDQIKMYKINKIKIITLKSSGSLALQVSMCSYKVLSAQFSTKEKSNKPTTSIIYMEYFLSPTRARHTLQISTVHVYLYPTVLVLDLVLPTRP